MPPTPSARLATSGSLCRGLRCNFRNNIGCLVSSTGEPGINGLLCKSEVTPDEMSFRTAAQCSPLVQCGKRDAEEGGDFIGSKEHCPGRGLRCCDGHCLCFRLDVRTEVLPGPYSPCAGAVSFRETRFFCYRLDHFISVLQSSGQRPPVVQPPQSSR